MANPCASVCACISYPGEETDAATDAGFFFIFGLDSVVLQNFCGPDGRTPKLLQLVFVLCLCFFFCSVLRLAPKTSHLLPAANVCGRVLCFLGCPLMPLTESLAAPYTTLTSAADDDDNDGGHGWVSWWAWSCQRAAGHRCTEPRRFGSSLNSYRTWS